MTVTKNEVYTMRKRELDDEYILWKSFHKEVSSYILPRRGLFASDEKPSTRARRDAHILTDEASKANRVLGAGMQGGLCSPSRPWFNLTVTDADLAKFKPVKEWLRQIQDIMYRVYAASNFYNVIHTCFEEEGGFGTTCMYQEEDPQTLVRFRIFTAGEYRISQNARQQVDVIYRDVWYSVRQMVQQFDINKFSTRTKQLIDKKAFEWIRLLHVIEPRKERNVNQIDSINMPFKSIWIEHGESELRLSESGYLENPVATARWNVAGNQPYGLGPGHDALKKAKLLQEFTKTGLKALHKMVDPPLDVPAKFKGVLDLRPAAVNFNANKERIQPIMDVRLPIGDLAIEKDNVVRSINETYYNDLFLMIANAPEQSPVTATEILEKKEEKLIMLGPTIERQIHELLDPTIDRTFNIIMRTGLAPPPPEEVQGQKLNVEYVSPLARAQRISQAQGSHAYLAMAERVAMLDESTIHKTDFDAFLEEYSEVAGVPPKIIRSKEEVDELRAADAEAAQAEAQMVQQAQAAENANKLGGAKSDEGTALADLKESLVQ